MNIQQKIELIEKYFHKLKAQKILDMSFIDYEEKNIYIVLNYFKKKNNYQISWIDLDLITSTGLAQYINYQCIDEGYLYFLSDKLNNKKIPKKYIVENDEKENKVNVKIYLNNLEYIYSFSKYLPYDLEFLVGCLFLSIFDYLPKLLEIIPQKLLSLFIGTNWFYEYKKTFDFDLYNGNINELFEKAIIERGEQYYIKNRVKYLEKIDNRYFAVVLGSNSIKYAVIINYNEEEKRMSVYCNCPCKFYCKHIYAVLKCIQQNIQKRFYKVAYKKQNIDLLERIMNFDYLLCLGIVENNLEVMNRNGNIELIPILDRNWEVLEDDTNRTLMNELNQIYLGDEL